MGKIALNSRQTDDLASLARDSAGHLPSKALAAIARALAQRRDDPPFDHWDAAAVVEQFDIKPTDFGMETGEVRLQVMSGLFKTRSLFGRKRRIYWVFAGPRDDDWLFPVSCHASLALAAETLMVAHSECSRL